MANFVEGGTNAVAGGDYTGAIGQVTQGASQTVGGTLGETINGAGGQFMMASDQF